MSLVFVNVGAKNSTWARNKLKMAEGDEEIVSMVDVLEEGKQMEEEAAAVLGDSDDKCCTYPLGYVNRQALYACVTCMEKKQTSAGICLACSYECHEGHEFVELYTKRNFCCDCGNSKFPNMTCKLIKNKQAENTDNKYNHNFAGVYCICKRPYPDPQDEIEDEMIQCVVCEDWFHGRHLGASRVPENEDYQEMVCGACMKRCDFLWYYTVHSLETKMVKEESTAEVDIMSHEQVQVKNESSTSPAVVATKELPTSSVAPTSQAPAAPATSDTTISSSSSMAGAKAIAHSETVTSAAAATASASADGVSSSTSDGTSDKELLSDKTLGNSEQEVGVTPATLATSTDTVATPVSATHTPETRRDVPTSSLDTTSRSEQGPVDATGGRGGDTLKRKRQDVAATSTDAASDAKPEERKENTAAGSSEYHRTMFHTTQETLSVDKRQEEEEESKVHCRFKELKNREVQRTEGAIFWPLGWRTKLCSCPECQDMYQTLEVTFLQDPEDTVVSYEERGKDKRRSLYGQGMEALSSMNRVQQVEMLHGYQDMKSALSEFLKSFADQGKVVTATDIQEFYDSLNRKRQRVGSASTVQYLCR